MWEKTKGRKRKNDQARNGDIEERNKGDKKEKRESDSQKV